MERGADAEKCQLGHTGHWLVHNAMRCRWERQPKIPLLSCTPGGAHLLAASSWLRVAHPRNHSSSWVPVFRAALKLKLAYCSLNCPLCSAYCSQVPLFPSQQLKNKSWETVACTDSGLGMQYWLHPLVNTRVASGELSWSLLPFLGPHDHENMGLQEAANPTGL